MKKPRPKVDLAAEEVDLPPYAREVGQALTALMAELELAGHSLSLIFCAEPQIKSLKLRYWGEDQTTDVLSFPGYEPGDPFMPPHLGDIWINVVAVADQALAAGHTEVIEACILAAHGTYHLLGHDHQTPEEWQGFEAVQRRMLELREQQV
jgi:probable rRNA maturation factor